jgi:hypothetical protein
MRERRMRVSAASILLFALAQMAWSPASASSLSPSDPLDQSYRQMYNLQFREAHETLHGYEQSHPGDPFGPTSDAAAYLFGEFDRLDVLQSELFVDDELFKNRKRPDADPAILEAFEQRLAESNREADAILQRSPNDRNALLAKVFDLGLEADYLSMIEKRNMAALRYTKDGGLLAEKLLAIFPDCYDAYLAVGVENYLLGVRPAPERWLFRLYGAEADKERGIRTLELTAQKGHYLLPFAQLLLAVAALRDKDLNRARELLRNLAQEFPSNGLYQKELARLP